jgi:RimJ/RimL family protein N-acetyltransferase
MTSIQTPHLRLQVCTTDHLSALINSNAVFEAQFQYRVIEGYIEFDGVLEWMLDKLQAGATPAWWSYLAIHTDDQALIGLVGYKGEPDSDGMVEIGYGVSPTYRGRGYATEAAKGLIAYAFTQPAVRKVWAHTLAEDNASVHVLRKCGMEKIAELDDPHDGRIWRWQILKPA